MVFSSSHYVKYLFLFLVFIKLSFNDDQHCIHEITKIIPVSIISDNPERIMTFIRDDPGIINPISCKWELKASDYSKQRTFLIQFRVYEEEKLNKYLKGYKFTMTMTSNNQCGNELIEFKPKFIKVIPAFDSSQKIIIEFINYVKPLINGIKEIEIDILILAENYCHRSMLYFTMNMRKPKDINTKNDYCYMIKKLNSNEPFQVDSISIDDLKGSFIDIEHFKNKTELDNFLVSNYERRNVFPFVITLEINDTPLVGLYVGNDGVVKYIGEENENCVYGIYNKDSPLINNDLNNRCIGISTELTKAKIGTDNINLADYSKSIKFQNLKCDEVDSGKLNAIFKFKNLFTSCYKYKGCFPDFLKNNIKMGLSAIGPVGNIINLNEHMHFVVNLVKNAPPLTFNIVSNVNSGEYYAVIELSSYNITDPNQVVEADLELKIDDTLIYSGKYQKEFLTAKRILVSNGFFFYNKNSKTTFKLSPIPNENAKDTIYRVQFVKMRECPIFFFKTIDGKCLFKTPSNNTGYDNSEETCKNTLPLSTLKSFTALELSPIQTSFCDWFHNLSEEFPVFSENKFISGKDQYGDCQGTKFYYPDVPSTGVNYYICEIDFNFHFQNRNVSEFSDKNLTACPPNYITNEGGNYCYFPLFLPMNAPIQLYSPFNLTQRCKRNTTIDFFVDLSTKQLTNNEYLQLSSFKIPENRWLLSSRNTSGVCNYIKKICNTVLHMVDNSCAEKFKIFICEVQKTTTRMSTCSNNSEFELGPTPSLFKLEKTNLSQTKCTISSKNNKYTPIGRYYIILQIRKDKIDLTEEGFIPFNVKLTYDNRILLEDQFINTDFKKKLFILSTLFIYEFSKNLSVEITYSGGVTKIDTIVSLQLVKQGDCPNSFFKNGNSCLFISSYGKSISTHLKPIVVEVGKMESYCQNASGSEFSSKVKKFTTTEMATGLIKDVVNFFLDNNLMFGIQKNEYLVMKMEGSDLLKALQIVDLSLTNANRNGCVLCEMDISKIKSQTILEENDPKQTNLGLIIGCSIGIPFGIGVTTGVIYYFMK